MEQITAAQIKEFIISANFPFTPTQQKLCIPIIKRICQKMENGIKFDDIKICDNLIIDGHHRYISSAFTKFPISSVLTNKTSATVPVDWKHIEFDEDDWDTASKILFLNERDAKFNDVDVEILNRITSV